MNNSVMSEETTESGDCEEALAYSLLSEWFKKPNSTKQKEGKGSSSPPEGSSEAPHLLERRLSITAQTAAEKNAY
jgi:hypothetical protein